MSKNTVFEKVNAPNPADAPPDMNRDANKGYTAPTSKGDAKVSADKLPPPKPPVEEKVDYDAFKKFQQQHANEGVSTRIPINPKTGKEWNRADAGAETDPASPWFVAADYNPATKTAGAAPAVVNDRPAEDQPSQPPSREARVGDPVKNAAADKFLRSDVGRRYVSMFERYAKPVFAVSAIFIGWVLYHQHMSKKLPEEKIEMKGLASDPLRFGGGGGGGIGGSSSSSSSSSSGGGVGGGLLSEVARQTGETAREIIRGVGSSAGYGIKTGVDLMADLSRGIGRLGDDAFRANYTDAKGKVLPAILGKAWDAAAGALKGNAELSKKRVAADKILNEIVRLGGRNTLAETVEDHPDTFVIMVELADIINSGGDAADRKQRMEKLLIKGFASNEQEAATSAQTLMAIGDVPNRSEIAAMYEESLKQLTKLIPKKERVEAAGRKLNENAEFQATIVDLPAEQKQEVVAAATEAVVGVENLLVEEPASNLGDAAEVFDLLKNTLGGIGGVVKDKAAKIIEAVKNTYLGMQDIGTPEILARRKHALEQMIKIFGEFKDPKTLRVSFLDVLKAQDSLHEALNSLSVIVAAAKSINEPTQRGIANKAIFDALFEVLDAEYKDETLENVDKIRELINSAGSAPSMTNFNTLVSRIKRQKQNEPYQTPAENLEATQGTITPALSRRNQPPTVPDIVEENIELPDVTPQKTKEENILQMDEPEKPKETETTIKPEISYQQANDENFNIDLKQKEIMGSTDYSRFEKTQIKGELETLREAIINAAKIGYKWSEVKNKPGLVHEKKTADEFFITPPPPSTFVQDITSDPSFDETQQQFAAQGKTETELAELLSKHK